MYKITLLILVLSLNLSQAYSQNEEDTVFYEMIHDSPELNWIGGGTSYDLDLNEYNFTLIAFGLDAMILQDKFSLNVYTRIHLFERLTDYAFSAMPIAESVYKKTKSRDAGIVGSYYFSNKTSSIESQVKLKSSGNTDYVMYVPTTLYTRIGFDLGIYSGSTYYNFGDYNLTGYDESGKEVNIISKNENYAISTYLTQQTVRLGASIVKSTNFSINTDKYGKKYGVDFTKLYGHILIGMNQNVDDVLMPVESIIENGYTRIDINTGMEMRKIGIALGYETYTMKPAKNFGIGTVVEAGIIPGPAGTEGVMSILSSFYLNIKLRFHLGKLL